MDNELQQLERRISQLENRSQQLTFPLDTVTNDIIKDKKLIYEREATGTITADKTLIVSINGKLYQINAL